MCNRHRFTSELSTLDSKTLDYDMKRTFAPKTFAARSFRSATLAGKPASSQVRLAEAQAATAGATAGLSNG
jgi:hypothetical protein